MGTIDCLSPQFPTCTMSVNCRNDCLNKFGDEALGACVDAIVATCLADTARYNFESSTQSWDSASGTTPFESVTQSTAQHFAGQASLAGSIAEASSNLYYLSVVPFSPIPAGATITFHVFVPIASTISWVQPFTQEGSPNFSWTGTAFPIASLTVGDWNTMTLKVPATSGAIAQLGVNFNVTAAWAGTVYVDSVDW